VDLVILDAVAYSSNEKGPWIPMKKTTAIFKEPKRKHGLHGEVITNLPHDPDNKAIEDKYEIIPEHQPMAHKMITSQS